MTLARYQFTVADDAGNVVPGAAVEVRAEVTGARLATLYSDRAGTTPLANPLAADANGFAAFHVAGGVYKITAYSGAFSQEWRYVGIGLAQESDALATGIRYLFDSGTADADPGAGYLRFNGSSTHIYMNNNDVSAWLDTWDDRDTGTVTIMSTDGSAFFIGAVSGAVVNATTYRKVTAASIASGGTFVEGQALSVVFVPNGNNGVAAGVRLTWNTNTAASDPGNGQIKINGGSTALYVDNLDRNGASITTWLDILDDGGKTADRGVVYIANDAGTKFILARVTGSVIDSTGYRTISITTLASNGTFSAAEQVGASFCMRGIDPTGDVAGPASAVSGKFASFDGTSGKLIADSGSSAATFATAAVGQGKQLLAYVPAAAMIPNATNGPTLGTSELGTNKNMLKTLDFDATTSESAQFSVAMPKKWDESTVTFIPYWMHGATTTNFGVVWALSGVAISDDDTLAAAFGTAQHSADTGGTTSDLYIGPESSAITIGGTPAELDFVNFKIARLPADGSDTMAIDARLIGVKVFYTTNAVTEA